MACQRGRDVPPRMGNGESPETFVTVVGIRARAITLSAGLTDARTAKSGGAPGASRLLVASAGGKRVEAAGSSVFVDGASHARIRCAYFNEEVGRCRLVVADFGVLAGPFVIAQLAFAGAHNDEATFSIRGALAGVIAFEKAGEYE